MVKVWVFINGENSLFVQLTPLSSEDDVFYFMKLPQSELWVSIDAIVRICDIRQSLLTICDVRFGEGKNIVVFYDMCDFSSVDIAIK